MRSKETATGAILAAAIVLVLLGAYAVIALDVQCFVICRPS